MPEIETGDYKGGERRNNGRLRLSLMEYVRIICLIATLLVGGVGGWIKLKGSVNALAKDTVELEETHEKDVNDIDKTLKKLLKLVQKQEVTNGKIQTTLDHIKEDVKHIKENGN